MGDKPALEPDLDRGEDTSRMEPLILPQGCRGRDQLNDVALQLAAASEGFRRSLPGPLVVALAELVRGMNCYYSNLIEGHNTHPVDIERAMNDDYSKDPAKRNLQLEARAHIEVQRWVDLGGVSGRSVTTEAICEIHRRFCALLPSELAIVTEPGTGRRLSVIPGELRREDVQVGRHVPVSPGALARFLRRFETVYGPLGRLETILAAAAAHHRLLWIHPFLDGNGRVARLMSHAGFLDTLKTGGLWSVARGLARRVSAYKEHLANCDAARRNDLDGRGALSEEALVDFTRFFLDVCLDQVRFMEELMQANRLRARVLVWIEEETKGGSLPLKSGQVMEAVLFRDELPRGDVPALLGMGERHSRRIVAALLNRGVLRSQSSRAPLFLALPASTAHRFMPGLFPDHIAES